MPSPNGGRAEVLRDSVTRADHTTDAGRRGSVFMFWMPGAVGGLISLPPYPPPYWTFSRDSVLRSTLQYESMWADAIYIGLTKISALSYDVAGDVHARVKRIHELLLQADLYSGWVQFLQKHLRDFLLTDNGAFIEIVRASSAAGSRITGLVPLDSRRCQRTGDPNIPVIYTDRQGRPHEMRDYQIILMADLPESSEPYFGVGFCAASRAYRAIYKLANIETYVSEKVSGRRALAIHLVSTISQEQLDSALATAEAEAAAKGQNSYLGAVVIPILDPSTEPKVATIELAGLPERFEAEKERRHAVLTYANAIGFDPQELDPALLESQAQGAGSQARVIDDKSSGKGLVAYRQQLTHKLNWEVLDSRTWFYFHERDFRDQQLRATIDGTIIDNTTKMQQSNILDEVEARQYLADHDVLSKDYLPVDLTQTETWSDTEKPPEGEPTEEEREAAIQALYEKTERQKTPPSPGGSVGDTLAQGGEREA